MPRRATGMSGSDKMEVDGGPPPLVFDDEDAVHARTLLYAQFANKRSTPHRYHTAASPCPVSRTFQLGGLGVRSHNFCEVVTSGAGVA